jgi:hypothetical protein
MAGLAWEDFDRQSEPLQIAMGSPGNATAAGQDPTLARGVTLTVTTHAFWPVSLETRCRLDTDRRTLDTVWMQPTGPVWIRQGDAIRCTLPPGPPLEDAAVTLFWTPFFHAVVGRCLRIGALGEHASQPFDLPVTGPSR